MAVLDIHLLGSPVLRERAEEIAVVDDALRSFIDDMFDTMQVASGIGLAANQVGVAKRVAIIDADQHTFTMINPVIVESSSTKESSEEGCLSIPDMFAEVTRPERIVFEALNEQGEPYRMELTGLAARAVQHEIDHLDGVLFIDYLGAMKRTLLVKRWKKENQGEGLTRTPTPEEPEPAS